MEYVLNNWGKKTNSYKLKITTSSTYIVRLIVLSKYTPFIELQLKRWFNRRGIRRVVELDWWGSHGQEKYKITAVPAQNSRDHKGHMNTHNPGICLVIGFIFAMSDFSSNFPRQGKVFRHFHIGSAKNSF